MGGVQPQTKPPATPVGQFQFSESISGKHKSNQMAATNSQTELLALIRGVSTEKSEGERRVVNLKKQIDELQLELESVNSELEEAKRVRECTEQELKGYEVQLSMNESSIQTLEGRISLIQDEISSIGSEVEALKNEEGDLRDEFIGKMFDLNSKIRKFQQSVELAFNEEFSSTAVSQDVNIEDTTNTREVEEAMKDLEIKLAQIISETNKQEDEFRSEQNLHIHEQKEVEDLKHKISLIEGVMEGTKDLQELTMQTSTLEDTFNSLGEKLQKKCICPNCHCDNAEILGGIFQNNS